MCTDLKMMTAETIFVLHNNLSVKMWGTDVGYIHVVINTCMHRIS